MATSSDKQDIQDFYKVASSYDFARIFQFRLRSVPGLGTDQDKLILAESLSLPGRAINNIPVPFMGLQFNVPGTASYPGSDSWTITFRCDADYDLRKAIEDETILTFDDSTSGGDYSIPTERRALQLDLLNSSFDTVRQYSLLGAYIVSMGEVSYDIGDGGNIVKIPVTLAYQYWRITDGASAFGKGGTTRRARF